MNAHPLPKVSVVIVNYRTPHLVVQAVESLRKHERTVSWEVILVDSASHDNSMEVFKRECPEAILVALNENRGFGAACNQGVNKAEGEFVAILNSDAFLVEPIFQSLIESSLNHPTPCLLGVAVLGPEGHRQAVTGKWPTFTETFIHVLGTEERETRINLAYQEQYDKDVDSMGHKVDWVNGTFLFMPRSVFQKLKGFDTRIFMYGEDVELGWRASRMGCESRYRGDLKISHLGGGSQKKGSLTSLQFTDRGRIQAAKLMRGPFFALGIRGCFFLRSSLRAIHYGFQAVLKMRTDLAVRSGIHCRRALELAIGL